MKYEIGIVGYGSIAKRHLKNLIELCKQGKLNAEIDLIRSGKGKELEKTEQEYIRNVYSVSDTIPVQYDVMFITNPTSLHYETICKYISSTKNMFIEKPIFHTAKIDWKKIAWKKDGIYYVACPLRYHNAILYVKNNINLDNVYSVRAICSSYLPEWRPNTDYTQSYSAKRELGGGVSIDLIHEWDYLIDLFGFPKNIIHFQGKYSDLAIETEDLSVYIGEYPERLIEVHLDYFGRTAIRQLELFTKEDTILVDLLEGTIQYKKNGRKVRLDKERDGYQTRELEDFFAMVEGRKENTNSVEHAYKVLQLITKERGEH